MPATVSGLSSQLTNTAWVFTYPLDPNVYTSVSISTAYVFAVTIIAIASAGNLNFILFFTCLSLIFCINIVSFQS